MGGTELGTWLLLNVAVSALGAGYFVYGKKTGRPVPLICGILLCVYTYAFDSLFWILVIGLVLSLLPFFIKYDP